MSSFANFTLWSSTILGILLLWAWICVQKTNKEINLLCDRSAAYFSTYPNDRWQDKKDHLDWFYAERHVAPEAHYWRRITLRNPWKLYGPISISLIKQFPMNDRFWDFYKYIYCNDFVQLNPYWKARIIEKMIAWRTFPSNNPMCFIMNNYFYWKLSDFMPQEEKCDMSAGAEEYDQIMAMQEAVGKI